MHSAIGLMKSRRFLPLFATQFLNAFNDNLFKTTMVLFVVYGLYDSARAETIFSAVSSALFILPFVLFSAVAGQLADSSDKAVLIRRIKAAEIVLMCVGVTGLMLAINGILVEIFAIPLMLLALFGTGVQSTFFGPIKYAILPQHLRRDDVLGGTGLVEGGTYIAILGGTVLAGLIAPAVAAVAILALSLIGYWTGRQVPPAPPVPSDSRIDWHLLRSSRNLLKSVLHRRKIRLAIFSISFFWAVGSVLIIQFPPLAKNVLSADKAVASLFLGIFSVGVAVGSVAINRLIKGRVTARYAPASVLAMGAFVLLFYFFSLRWDASNPEIHYSLGQWLAQPGAVPVLASLFGIAVAGGMFVVPLYAFLTTSVSQGEAARTIAANNIVNSFAMVLGGVLALSLSYIGIRIVEQLLLSAVLCIISAVLAIVLEGALKAETAAAPD